MLKLIELFMLVFLLNNYSLIAQVSIVPHGHSHNDYTRKRPLYDALANGFQSLEIDVFYYKKELVVSHTHTFLFLKKTIEELYIKPLDSIYSKQGQFFEEDSAHLILYVDTKNDNDSICTELLELINKYPHLFTHWENGIQFWGPLKMLSTCYHLESDSLRFIQKNGGLSEIENDIPATIFPRVNSAYRWVFKWNGKREMPKDEEQILKDWVKKAHTYNREIRFWGAGNKENLWHKLLLEKVDWINVDKLEKYRAFYFENFSK